MSISQLDPSLLSSQPLNQSPGTPNLADLSLGSEFSGISMGRTRSEADPNRANEKPKRTRRTKAQMAAYRADLERSKKLTAVEKITEGAKRGHKGRCGRSSQRSAPGTSTPANSTSSTPAASQVSVLDSNPAFVLSDYENSSQSHRTQPVPFSNPFNAKSNTLPAASRSYIPAQSNSLSANHAGENAYARHLAQESRMTKSKEPTKASKPNTRTINCSLMLYKDGVLLDKKGLFCTKQLVNLNDPSLYDNLRVQLWKVFAPDIVAHTEIKSLAISPMRYLFLGQGTAKIPNQEVLSSLISETSSRKKLVLDLMYFHPGTNDSSPSSSQDMSSTINQTKNSYTVTETQSRKRRNTSPAKVTNSSKAIHKSWALGISAASKRVKNLEELAAHLGRLSKRVLHTTDQTTSGPDPEWIIGNRLCFFTGPPPTTSTPPSSTFQLSNGIHVATYPITYRVNLNQKIGEGSMRTAYAAQVKTDLGGGHQHINHWVAKVRRTDVEPSIHKHATDALMYEGFAYLLQEYKESLLNCTQLDESLAIKASNIQVSQTPSQIIF
ncbi:hypothetical protein PtB15_1B168 [Puccinia triticina]|nr:hypothetical protein PtB15_1B168 [Puccinia triticina]